MRDVQRNLAQDRTHADRVRRFLFAVVRDVQRNLEYEVERPDSPFLFAVVRDVQRNITVTSGTSGTVTGFYSLSCETYSGTTPALPTAPSTAREVSIRCRARRTAELLLLGIYRFVSDRFYSLSCETYSGTSDGPLPLPPRRVSIRCRARRTAELGAWGGGVDYVCFYSLSCETYSGTYIKAVSGNTVTFLFAVVRDVQRNQMVSDLGSVMLCFYSLSCETYSGTSRIEVGELDIGFYSLSCETYSGTGYDATWYGLRAAEFLFAVVRDVQRNPTPSDTPSDLRKRCPFAHPTSHTSPDGRFYPQVTVFPQVRALHTRRGYRSVANHPLRPSSRGAARLG